MNSNYKNKKKIMKENKIYETWTKFIDDYEEYFKTESNDKIWYDKLNTAMEPMKTADEMRFYGMVNIIKFIKKVFFL